MKAISAVLKYVWGLSWTLAWACAATASLSISTVDPYVNERGFWLGCAYFSAIFAKVVMDDTKKARNEALALLTD